MPPRILILSASVGAGHMRAAEAVEKACRQMVPDAHVTNVDVLAMTNALFRRVYGKLYIDLVNKRRTCWATFTTCWISPAIPASQRGDRFRLAAEKLNLRQVHRLS